MIGRHKNGTLLVEFGTGDIGIYVGGEKGCGALMFQQQEPQPIAFPKDFGVSRNADSDECPVTMLFKNPASVDAFIQSLEQAKKIMAGEIVLCPGKQESEG